MPRARQLIGAGAAVRTRRRDPLGPFLLPDGAEGSFVYARHVAAWIKAFGYPPSAAEIGPVLRLNVDASRARADDALRHGLLHVAVMHGERRFEPEWRYILGRLARVRPMARGGRPRDSGPPEVEVYPLRYQFERSGVSKSELCRRLGWMSPDINRLNRTLGFAPPPGQGLRRSISYALAEKVVAALLPDVDPYQCGV